MQILPPALVPAARTALQNEGFDPNTIGNDGTLNVTGVIARFYNTVTIRTSVTPDLVFPISPDGGQPDRATQELLNELRPTVILSGPAGVYELAPYGNTQGQTSWWPLALAGGGLALFLGWAIFGK